MDQFVVDIDHIPGVQLHDEVVLVGQQGEGHIPAEEVARWAETINYEVTTSLLPRVVRIFLRGGKEVERTTLVCGAEREMRYNGEQEGTP
jgi:alanine racemase